MKKSVLLTLLVGMFLTGCTNNQTKQLVEQQNKEVIALQQLKMQVLARPTKNAQELLQKKAELKVIDDEIKSAQAAQANAQQIENEKNSNMIKNVITGTGAVIGTAFTIHELTK